MHVKTGGPASNVNMQTYQTTKQDVQVASVALLEGEEKRMPSMSSK